MNKVDLNVPKHAEQANIKRSKDAGRATQAELPQATESSAQTSDSDKIKVSERASSLGQLAARASELPDVRQDRVEALRERIQSGSYNPSATDIADAILRDES
jgi:negative regulator of flagellin synthesis FlgM